MYTNQTQESIPSLDLKLTPNDSAPENLEAELVYTHGNGESFSVDTWLGLEHDFDAFDGLMLTKSWLESSEEFQEGLAAYVQILNEHKISDGLSEGAVIARYLKYLLVKAMEVPMDDLIMSWHSDQSAA